MQEEQAKMQMEAEKMQMQAELKSQLMAEEFNYNMKLKDVEVEGLSKREDAKETAKDKRIDRQNTQQSKLIEQRKKDLPPINFESSEDNLDGFNFGQFGPR
jgi:homoserine dehydrogenase